MIRFLKVRYRMTKTFPQLITIEVHGPEVL